MWCRWLLPEPSQFVSHEFVVSLQAAPLVADLRVPQLPQVERVVELQVNRSIRKASQQAALTKRNGELALG